jgi:hypothetical protein
LDTCDDGAYGRMQVYDPDSGDLSSLVWTPWAFDVAGTAKLLPDGNVLMMLEAVECDYGLTPLLYNASASSFSGGDMLMHLCLPTGTLLSDGTALITNGYFTQDAWIYDPGSAVLSPTGDMRADHGLGRATLLNDGTVLMTGGIHLGGGDCCLNSDAAELYHPGIARPAPVLLSVSPDGQGAILHASTQQLVSLDHPAVAGEALEVYLTGLLDGNVIPPQVAIGGHQAEVLFFGAAPGYAGLNQINVRVPSGVAPGQAVPVRLHYLGRPSNEVTIDVN